MNKAENCLECGFAFRILNQSNPCSKCKGTTQIIKNPDSEFYTYAEKCQSKKCGYSIMLGIPLEVNKEEYFGQGLQAINEDGTLKQPTKICAICRLSTIKKKCKKKSFYTYLLTIISYIKKIFKIWFKIK